MQELLLSYLIRPFFVELGIFRIMQMKMMGSADNYAIAMTQNYFFRAHPLPVNIRFCAGKYSKIIAIFDAAMILLDRQPI